MTPSTTNTAARELLPCVMCGCPDELELDSSSAAEASWIECSACQYRMQKKCDEETLAERWNELDRRDMPAFVTPTETPARDVPAQEASLRRTLDYWHGRAKTAEAKLTLTQQQGGEQEADVEQQAREFLARQYDVEDPDYAADLRDAEVAFDFYNEGDVKAIRAITAALQAGTP